MKRPALRVPIHISPAGPERPNDNRSSACERTSPAAPPNNAGSPLMPAQAARRDRGRGDGRPCPRPASGCPAAAGGRSAPPCSRPEGYDIDVDQDREVGGDDLQQMLETQRLQHRQRRLVHAALAGKVAAAQCDQVLVFVLHPLQVVAQAFEHEMLKIEHAVAVVAARRPQQAECRRMLFEEIRVLAQIGDDVGGAGVARPARRRLAAAERFRLVLRAIGQR